MTRAGFEVNLECYLWDLVDEGIDTALDRIKNDTGVTGIGLEAYRPGLQVLRPHAGVSPRWFKTEGGAQFQPDLTRYAGTRLRPIVPKWLRKTNPLKAIVAGCRNRGLKVAARVRLYHHPEMAERYEHAVIQDAFGEKLDWLCPVNPDVQEYLRALLSDLSENYELDHIRVGELGFPVVSGRGSANWPLGCPESWLGCFCFCDACRHLSKRDGIDLDSIRCLVRDTLERAFQTGDSLQQKPALFVRDHPPMVDYLTWRSAQLQTWVASLRRVCRCGLAVDSTSDAWLTFATDSFDLCYASSFDAHGRSLGSTTVEAIDSVLRGSLKICPPEKTCVAIGASSQCPDSSELVAALGRIAKAGCHSASISNYGTIPLARLDWIRQAVRFARRESM